MTNKIMDYKKKYNEALKDMMAIYPNLKGDAKLAVEHAFPELAESEDERNWKIVMEYVKDDALRDWLEKQKEPHYTKRNALFDKCVAECDPAVMKEVSDEIDEMLEKEQKPNIELIQRSWYMEGYHDREFGKEPKWILKTGEGGPKHELNPRYGEYIKKEQKPASTEDMPYITDEHFFEREPKDSFRYKLAKYMTQNSRKEESPDGYTYHISAETILEMAKEELLKRGELQKQKPAEWSEEDEDMRLEAIRVLVSGCERYRKESGCLPGWHKVISWLKSLRPVNKEWSEEDNIGWDEAFACVTRAEKAAKNEEELQNAVTAEKWLKEIKFKYCVHPVKPEWSKEETKDLVHILKVLDDCYIYGKHDLSKTDYDNLTSTLKSLRPSWKPSEEQMKALQNAVALTACDKELAGLYNQLKKYSDGKN